MTPVSTPDDEAHYRFVGQASAGGDAQRPAQPASPAKGTEPKPNGEPEPPTDKPLPDLPNPAEVGEDG